MSHLETLRRLHADIETLKQLSVKSLQSRATPQEPAAPLAPLASARQCEQLTTNFLLLAQSRAQQIQSLPKPKDQLVLQDNPLSSFYTRLRDIRQLHRNAGAAGVPDETRILQEVQEKFPDVVWSGEELGGTCLDLLLWYQRYLNVVKDKVPYLEYVKERVIQFDKVPLGARVGRRYVEYVDGLAQYLTEFGKRAHPLDNIQRFVDDDRHKYIRTIEKGLAEIADRGKTGAEALVEAYKPEQLKQMLIKHGLKCGGRPIDRAKRLLSAAKNLRYGKQIVSEHIIHFHLTTLLLPERQATLSTIQKKHSLTYTELESERDALEVPLTDQDISMEDTKPLYNPKDVPLGWDGKPIPYWMYKLHGLNHEYKCEICGNASYRGPRAFERHFTDWQHVSGLRRLGIGYSRAFMMITDIEDARRLDTKLKKRGEEIEGGGGEWEDDQGNVMGWKTFQDLKRQGLI